MNILLSSVLTVSTTLVADASMQGAPYAKYDIIALEHGSLTPQVPQNACVI
jgi:hypothetical protein